MDARFESNIASLGLITRDHNRHFLNRWEKLLTVFLSEEVETRAFSLAVGIAKDLHLQNVIFESDCKAINDFIANFKLIYLDRLSCILKMLILFSIISDAVFSDGLPDL